MSRKLIPRFTAQQAGQRLLEIQDELRAGKRGAELVRVELGGAVPNPTGGEAPTQDHLRNWQREVSLRMRGQRTGTKLEKDRHGVLLGQAISDVIDPIPSDAAHDGVWSYLALMLFPDLVLARWPGEAATGELSSDRWIGSQLGRDRNYLKLSWRRWQVLGPVTEGGGQPLGEDEFGALLERTSVARNTRLVMAAAGQILAFKDHAARSDFAREFMKELTYLTGPLNLELLTDEELTRLTGDLARSVAERSRPKRAL